MLKYTVLLLVVAGSVLTLQYSDTDTDGFHCKTPTKSSATVCFIKKCTDAITTHIKEELNAAFAYMFIGAQFEDKSIARPGLAKFLFESASEEREHAISMLAYLEKRGIVYNENYTNTLPDIPYKAAPTYQEALETALNLEIMVTQKIYEVITSCATDFHGADFFTESIMAEQHEGIRKLQGAIQSFQDLTEGHDPKSDLMAEFLFDRKMLTEGL